MQGRMSSPNIDLPAARGTGSLSFATPSPPPMSSASESRSMSRSPSYSGPANSKRLVFQGQIVEIVLPSVTPELLQWINDVVLAVQNIHKRDEDEVKTRCGVR